MSTILQNHYVLAVHEVRKSADFYVNVLGFQIVNKPDGHRITIGHALGD